MYRIVVLVIYLRIKIVCFLVCLQQRSKAEKVETGVLGRLPSRGHASHLHLQPHCLGRQGCRQKHNFLLLIASNCSFVLPVFDNWINILDELLSFMLLHLMEDNNTSKHRPGGCCVTLRYHLRSRICHWFLFGLLQPVIQGICALLEQLS